MSSGRPHTFLRPLLIFCFFGLAFFTFWGHSIIFRDSFHFYASNKFLVSEGIRSFQIYGWNPFQFLGTPFVADIQAGWFYPLNLIYVLFPFAEAHNLFILIHYPLAAVFMDMFLRNRGVDGKAALVAAIAFSLSGYLISQHSMVRMLLGAAWAPLVFYSIDRALSRGKVGWASLSCFGLSMQVLSGDPLTAGVTASVVVLWTVCIMVRERKIALPLGVLVVAGLGSFVLSACQLLPTYEMISLSDRAGGLPLEESLIFSFHPSEFFSMVWPLPFGTIWPEFNFWGSFVLDSTYNNPWSITNYLGLPVITLGALGFVGSRRKWKWWVLGGALFFFVLSLGRYTPVYSWFHHYFPFFSSFRYPAKYQAWVVGFISVAAGLGAERLRELVEEKRRPAAVASVIYATAVVALSWVALFLVPLIAERTTGISPESPPFLSILEHTRAGFRHVIFVNLVLAVFVFAAARKLVPIKTLLPGIIVIVAFDCWAANSPTMPYGPLEIFDFRPVAAEAISPGGKPELGRTRIFRGRMEFRDTNPALEKHPRYVRQRIWERNTLKRNLNNMEGFEDIIGYGSSQLETGGLILESELTPRVLTLYNVRYFITSFGRPSLTSVRSEIIYQDPVNDVSIQRFSDAFPRAYIVGRALLASDDRAALELMAKTDLEKAVVISSEEVLGESGKEYPLVPAEISSYGPNRVVVRTDAGEDGWLVLSDRFYPGWSASLDGKETDIYRANLMVRAVRVPAGDHEIEFVFESPLLRTGLVISVAGWAALLIFWLVTLIIYALRGPRQNDLSSAD